MAGCSSDRAGEAGQPRVGRPVGAGHHSLPHSGPAGGGSHCLQQEDGQCPARGWHQSGIRNSLCQTSHGGDHPNIS